MTAWIKLTRTTGHADAYDGMDAAWFTEIQHRFT